MFIQNPLNYEIKDDPWSSHSIIKNRLMHLPSGSKVLDVGTADGILGMLCFGEDLLLFGLEPNKELAELAQPYYEDVKNCSLEDTSEDYLRDYDVVVCGDVLEHMVYPDTELMRLINLQRSGTRFIISVPNIANLWIRLSLLFGYFEYSDRGILDHTHLRFFTKKTLFKMLNLVGLQINHCYVTPVPLVLVNPMFQVRSLGRFIYRLLAKVSDWFPTILGYQFIVEAEKRSNDYEQ